MVRFNPKWVHGIGKFKTMWWILIQLGKLLERIAKFQPESNLLQIEEA
jgi:hypothetical protein